MGKIQKHFTKENRHMENKHMKRYSASLAIKMWKLKPQWDITIHPLE